MDLIDFSISLVIILFILSIMTEKLTQLIKDYPVVFNAILLITTVCIMFRGVGLLFYPSQIFVFRLLAGSFCFLLNLLILVSLKRLINQKYLNVFLIIFLLVNLLNILIYSLNAYITCAFILGYLCLTGLKLLPEISFNIGTKAFNTSFFQRIQKRGDVINDELKREKEIKSLSFVVGFIIAYFFNANFFTIITNLSNGKGNSGTPLNLLSWDVFPLNWRNGYFAFEHFKFQPEFAFGLLLTGFFLSFGSKFFHDLLETLFYAKKAKLALNDSETYQQTSADAVQNFVNNYDIENFYYRQKAALLSIPGIISLGIGSVKKEGVWVTGIRIYAKEKQAITDNLFLIEKNKNVLVKIPYEIFRSVSGSKVTAGNIDAADQLGNKENMDSTGSFAFPVTVQRDGIAETGNFLLSCYHVVKHPTHRWDGVNASHRQVATKGDGEVGEIIAGARTIYAETALIKLSTDTKINAEFFPGYDIKIITSRIVNADDVGRRVAMYSRIKNKKVDGIIRSYDFTDSIYFDDANENNGFNMHKLIEVQGIDGGSIQEYGDSGNLLFDEYGYAIGIVFAKNDNQYTLAMRIDQALDITKAYGYTVNLKTNIS